MSGTLFRKQPQTGIDGVGIYAPLNWFSLEELAEVRGVEYAKYNVGLGCEEMAVLSPSEDPVTMGANALYNLFEQSQVDPEEIGYLAVATESDIDASKPIAVYIHDMLSLPKRCRVMDVRNACYAGTAAMKGALAWSLTPAARGRKAVVIATDVAYYEQGSPGEPTQGAAAVALLISVDPRIMEISLDYDAVYTNEVMDFWRPHYRNSALVDGHYSMECYLTALSHTCRDYMQMTGLTYKDFDHFVFHTPFPKMAMKAHKLLYGSQLDAWTEKDYAECERAYEKKVHASVVAAKKIGNVYSASLFMAIISMLEYQKLAPGERVGMYSYGSGSSAEFMSGILKSGVSEWNFNTGLAKQIARRRQVSYDQYILLRGASEMRMRDGSFTNDKPGPDRPFVYQGIKNHRRRYEWLHTIGVSLQDAESCSEQG